MVSTNPNNQKKSILVCQVCKKVKKKDSLMPGQLVRDSVIDVIKKDHPDWSSEGYICLDDLNNYRGIYVADVLEKEKGELSALDKQVLASLRKHETLSKNIDKEFETELTFGERIADKVAEFGGSWTFIITFFSILLVWILINAIVLLSRAFDPFPFILLNLVLSCLAAIQAPIIMMSQNRQETKDRLRGEQDYRVNLKAELMIKHLNQKMDELLSNQWARLLEIQQIQVQLMEQLLKKK